MITDTDYLKAKQIVEEYESKHLNISVVSGSLQIDADTEEYGRKCFYEGREIARYDEHKRAIFKHPTYNGYIRFLEGK